MLIAAGLLGLAAGISWVRRPLGPWSRELLGLPPDRFVRTMIAVGHPSEAALRPKSAPGDARLPAAETVFEERWPQGLIRGQLAEPRPTPAGLRARRKTTLPLWR